MLKARSCPDCGHVRCRCGGCRCGGRRSGPQEQPQVPAARLSDEETRDLVGIVRAMIARSVTLEEAIAALDDEPLRTKLLERTHPPLPAGSHTDGLEPIGGKG